MIDIDHLSAGASYRDLPESYVIFICTFDPFGKGLIRYSFLNMCREETDLELGDGAHKIFVNAVSTMDDIDEDMRALLDYINGMKPTSSLTQYIADSITAAKENKKWERDYMLIEEMLKEERDAGRSEGRIEGEDLFAELTEILLASGRYDDLKRAVNDKPFRQELYEELGLELEKF